MFLSLKNALGKTLGSTFRGLLDSFSGASAAYSLRLLSGAYSGHALRVRRNDNVEVDVGFNGGSVSLSSPITNVSGEPVYTVNYTDSSWQFTGSAFSGPNSANTGAFDFGGNTSTLTCSLDFDTPVLAGNTLSVSFTVNSITNSGVISILPAGGGSPIAQQTVDSTGSKTIAFSNLSATAVEVAFGFTSTSSSINVSSFQMSATSGDTAATTLGAFMTELSSSTDLFVETWYDQSGNSRDAVQTTTAEQPKLASSGTLETDANGKITMLFDGTDDDFDLPSTVMSSLDSVSAFNVCSTTETGSSTRIGLGLSRSQGGAKRHYLPVKNSGQFFHSYDAQFAGSAQKLADADTNQHLFSSVAGSSTAKGFFDGTEKFSKTSVDTYASNTAGGIGSTNGGSNWQGDISEIIIYDSDQTSDFDAINTQIKSYYGIS